jgi:hypothetical protein
VETGRVVKGGAWRQARGGNYNSVRLEEEGARLLASTRQKMQVGDGEQKEGEEEAKGRALLRVMGGC